MRLTKLYHRRATDDDNGISIEVYSTVEEALLNLRLKVREEYESGLIAIWLNYEGKEDGEDEDGKLVINSRADSFEAYIEGWYNSNHYSVSITKKRVMGGAL